ncbi:peptide ABC transporter substrate-binding protein, partial [Bacillus cereus]
MKKKQMKKLTAVVAPVLAMSMALTACSTSGGDKKTSTNSSSSGDSKSGEKLAAKQVLNRTVTQEIPTMDSSKSTDTVSSQMLGNTMEGLYRLDKDNKPIPAAAESSTKSEDG